MRAANLPIPDGTKWISRLHQLSEQDHAAWVYEVCALPHKHQTAILNQLISQGRKLEVLPLWHTLRPEVAPSFNQALRWALRRSAQHHPDQVRDIMQRYPERVSDVMRQWWSSPSQERAASSLHWLHQTLLHWPHLIPPSTASAWMEHLCHLTHNPPRNPQAAVHDLDVLERTKAQLSHLQLMQTAPVAHRLSSPKKM